jgi:hypothetical protein
MFPTRQRPPLAERNDVTLHSRPTLACLGSTQTAGCPPAGRRLEVDCGCSNSIEQLGYCGLIARSAGLDPYLGCSTASLSKSVMDALVVLLWCLVFLERAPEASGAMTRSALGPQVFILVAVQCTAYHSRLPCIHSNHSLFISLSLFCSLSLPSFAFVMNDAVFQLIRILMWSVVYGELRHLDTIMLTRLTHLRSLCCFIHRRSLPHRPLWITLLRTLHRHRLHALHDHGHYQLVRSLGSTRRADAAWNLG